MGNFTQAFDRRTYFTSYYFMLNIFARAFTGFTSETVHVACHTHKMK